MGQGISLGSQRLSSCLAEDHLLIVRASLVPLTTINTKSLRALPLRKKHRFSFSFLNLHSLSFIQQLQICNIEDTYFGEVKSNKDFSHNLYFESAHRPPGEFQNPRTFTFKRPKETYGSTSLLRNIRGCFHSLCHLPQCHRKLSDCREGHGSSSPDLHSNATSTVPSFLSLSISFLARE